MQKGGHRYGTLQGEGPSEGRSPLEGPWGVMMPSDDSPVPVAERLHELMASTKQLLGELKLVAEAGRKHLTLHAALSKQSRQTKEEKKVFKDSYQSYLDEGARIAKETRRISEEVYGGTAAKTETKDLVNQVWDLFKDLEFDYPDITPFTPKYQEWLESVMPERQIEITWLKNFLSDLYRMLRDAHQALSDSGVPVGEYGQSTPPEKNHPHPRSIDCPQAAEKLLAFKREYGLTNQAVSKRIGGKVTPKTIGKFLREGMATPAVLDEIAAGMGITKDQLLRA
jgi:hypothetical protein